MSEGVAVAQGARSETADALDAAVADSDSGDPSSVRGQVGPGRWPSAGDERDSSTSSATNLSIT